MVIEFKYATSAEHVGKIRSRSTTNVVERVFGKCQAKSHDNMVYLDPDKSI